jgi:hypothetical protein
MCHRGHWHMFKWASVDREQIWRGLGHGVVFYKSVNLWNAVQLHTTYFSFISSTSFRNCILRYLAYSKTNVWLQNFLSNLEDFLGWRIGPSLNRNAENQSIPHMEFKSTVLVSSSHRQHTSLTVHPLWLVLNIIRMIQTLSGIYFSEVGRHPTSTEKSLEKWKTCTRYTPTKEIIAMQIEEFPPTLYHHSEWLMIL